MLWRASTCLSTEGGTRARSQSQTGRECTPILPDEGTSILTDGGCPYPSHSGCPHPRSGQGDTLIPGQDEGYPIPGQNRMGIPPVGKIGIAPSEDWMGVSPPPEETEQHSEYLLHGGQYASSIHEGGFSCLYIVLKIIQGKKTLLDCKTLELKIIMGPRNKNQMVWITDWDFIVDMTLPLQLTRVW